MKQTSITPLVTAWITALYTDENSNKKAKAMIRIGHSLYIGDIDVYCKDNELQVVLPKIPFIDTEGKHIYTKIINSGSYEMRNEISLAVKNAYIFALSMVEKRDWSKHFSMKNPANDNEAK